MQPDLARAVLLTDDLAQLLKLSIAAQLLDDKDGDGDGKLTREEVANDLALEFTAPMQTLSE